LQYSVCWPSSYAKIKQTKQCNPDYKTKLQQLNHVKILDVAEMTAPWRRIAMGGLGGRPACRGRPHSGSQRGWPARLQGRPRSTTNNTLPDACSMPIRRGSMTRSHPEPRALGGGEARRGSVRCSGRADATSATSPPRCCRRCWQLSAGPDGIHHLACLMCASLLHMGRERESRS